MIDSTHPQGLRITLDPELGTAVTGVLNRANVAGAFVPGASPTLVYWPNIVSTLEKHDPRCVGALVDQIRRASEEAWPKWSSNNRAEVAVRLVKAALKIDADVAYPLMTVWSGYARETAVRGIEDIRGSFCLAMLIHRTNDWVETVRITAETKLAALKGSIKSEIVLGCIEVLWNFRRLGRASSFARLLVWELSNKPEVLAGLKNEASRGRTDRSLRIFRKLLQSSVLDEELLSIATASPHPRIRADATRALLSGSARWADEGEPQIRTIQITIARADLARTQLNDRSPAVQLAALEYIAVNGNEWADYKELLLPFADSRRGSLADIARWGLKQAGVNWVAILRASFMSEPSPRIASVLGKFGTPEDGAALHAVASTMPDAMALPYLAAAAEQKIAASVERLTLVAIRSGDAKHARRASRMLFRIGIVLDQGDLQTIADRGSEFFARGLGLHFSKLSVVTQLKILARLEAANANFSLEEWFAKPNRKVNRGAFVVSDNEREELRLLMTRAPRLQSLAHRLLAI